MVEIENNFVGTNSIRAKLIKELSGWKKIVILGIGNEMNEKDNMGILIAQGLQKMFPDKDKVKVIVTGNRPENYTGLLKQLSPSHILLIDTAEMGNETIKIIDACEIEEGAPSAHNGSLSMMIKYLERAMEAKVITLGVNIGQTFRFAKGNSVCDFIKQAIEETKISRN